MGLQRGWEERATQNAWRSPHPAKPKTRQRAREILALIKSMVACSNSVRVLPQISFVFFLYGTEQSVA